MQSSGRRRDLLDAHFVSVLFSSQTSQDDQRHSGVLCVCDQLEAWEIDHDDRAVLNIQDTGGFQYLNCGIDSLAREPGELPELLLRSVHDRASSRIDHRIEQPDKRSCQTDGRILNPLRLRHGHELPQSFIELLDDEMVEFETCL